jgi:hypothetical protein
MKVINITRMATAIGVAGVFGVASMAIAADTKPAAKPAVPAVTDPATLPKFAGVRVVNATPEQLAALAKERATSQGMRAYVDPTTKQLRPATPEDLAAESAAAPAAKAGVARRSALAAPEAAVAEVTTLENGARTMALGEEHMSFAIAHIAKDGSVHQDCVEDHKSAVTAVKGAAPEGDRHDK